MRSYLLYAYFADLNKRRPKCTQPRLHSTFKVYPFSSDRGKTGIKAYYKLSQCIAFHHILLRDRQDSGQGKKQHCWSQGLKVITGMLHLTWPLQQAARHSERTADRHPAGI